MMMVENDYMEKDGIIEDTVDEMTLLHLTVMMTVMMKT